MENSSPSRPCSFKAYLVVALALLAAFVLGWVLACATASAPYTAVPLTFQTGGTRGVLVIAPNGWVYVLSGEGNPERSYNLDRKTEEIMRLNHTH